MFNKKKQYNFENEWNGPHCHQSALPSSTWLILIRGSLVSLFTDRQALPSPLPPSHRCNVLFRCSVSRLASNLSPFLQHYPEKEFEFWPRRTAVRGVFIRSLCAFLCLYSLIKVSSSRPLLGWTAGSNSILHFTGSCIIYQICWVTFRLQLWLNFMRLWQCRIDL